MSGPANFTTRNVSAAADRASAPVADQALGGRLAVRAAAPEADKAATSVDVAAGAGKEGVIYLIADHDQTIMVIAMATGSRVGDLQALLDHAIRTIERQRPSAP